MKSLFSFTSELSGIFILTCVAIIFGTLLPIGFNLAVMNSPAEVEKYKTKILRKILKKFLTTFKVYSRMVQRNTIIKI